MFSALLLAFGLLAAPAPAQSTLKAQPFMDFSGGLNTEKSSLLISDNESPSLRNVVFDKAGGISRREGYAKRNAVALTSGLGAVNGVYQLEQSNGTKYCLAFSSSSGQYSTDGCQTFTQFVSTLTANAEVNCDAFQDREYCVNGTYNFYFDGTNDVPFTAIAGLKYIRVHRNRCFAVGATIAPSRVYYSALGNCASWTTATDFFDLSPEDGDIGTGIGTPLFDLLPFYKKFSTWALKGNTPESWVLVNISKNTGALNHRSIDNFNNVQLFDSLGPNGGRAGVYSFNGIVVQEASRKLRNEIESLDTFRSSQGRRAVDSKADWDSGTFDSMAMSSSRDSGFMQSSFTTITETFDTHWNTGASTGGVSIYASSMTSGIALINSGFEDGLFTGWTAVNNGGGILGTRKGAVPPIPIAFSTGNYSAGYCGAQADAQVTVEILNGATDALVSSRAFAYPSLGADVAADTSLESATTLKIKASFNSGTASLTSPAFARTDQVRYAAWLGGGAACSGFGTSNGYGVDMPQPFYLRASTYTSNCYDLGISTPIWGTFDAAISSNTSQRLTFTANVSTSCTGVFDSSTTLTNGITLGMTPRRFLRYSGTFLTSLASATAVMDRTTLTAASTGTWQSPELTLTAGAINSWGLFDTVQTVSGGGASISYCLKTATTSTQAQYAACLAVTPGAVIAVSTGAYVIVRGTWTVSYASDTARTDSIVMNWAEGAGGTSSAGRVYNGRYHYCAQPQGGTQNSVCYVLDSNNAWSKWTNVIARSLGVVNQSFVMGSSSTTAGGYVYRLYDGDSDDGGGIDAYWASRDLPIGGIENIKSIDRMYTVHAASATVLNLTLGANGGLSSKSFSLDLSTGGPFGIKQSITQPAINGNTFRVSYSNTAASKPWQILGFILYFRDLGLMP